MVNACEIYQQGQTNLIVPLQLYAEHQQVCSERGLTREVGMIIAGCEINPRNFIVTDYRGFEGKRDSAILSDKINFIDGLILPLLTRLTEADKICGVNKFRTETLVLDSTKSIEILKDKKIIGGSHTHPRDYGVGFSEIDRENIQRYIQFAQKYPSIHASNHGNIEWIIEPRENPFQNRNKAYVVNPGTGNEKEINLIIVAGIRDLLMKEFGFLQ